MSIERYLVNKIQPPALPVAQAGPLRTYLDDLNNILRLFFARVSNNVNLLTGSDGGRFIDSPNGLFWDNADQTLAAVNVGFHGKYLGWLGLEQDWGSYQSPSRLLKPR